MLLSTLLELVGSVGYVLTVCPLFLAGVLLAYEKDLMIPGASGEGYQGSPVMAVDGNGDIHLVWIARDNLTAPTTLRYLRGGAVDE